MQQAELCYNIRKSPGPSAEGVTPNMAIFKNLEEAQEYFKDDRFATENGASIVEVTEDHAVVKMELADRHRNAMNNVMGGAIFTLADFAFAVLASNLHKAQVGTDATIHFLSVPKGDVLYAKSVCRKNGRTTIIMDADVTDESGRLIATMTGTAFKIYPKA